MNKDYEWFVGVCSICKKYKLVYDDDCNTLPGPVCVCDDCDRKIVEYYIDGDALKFWIKYKHDDWDEIDLNKFIDWNDVVKKGLKELKIKFGEGTVFVKDE